MITCDNCGTTVKRLNFCKTTCRVTYHRHKDKPLRQRITKPSTVTPALQEQDNRAIGDCTKCGMPDYYHKRSYSKCKYTPYQG